MATELHLARNIGVVTRQGQHKLSLPLPRKPSNPENFALPELEGKLMEYVPIGQVLDLQQCTAGLFASSHRNLLELARLASDMGNDLLRIAPLRV